MKFLTNSDAEFDQEYRQLKKNANDFLKVFNTAEALVAKRNSMKAQEALLKKQEKELLKKNAKIGSRFGTTVHRFCKFLIDYVVEEVAENDMRQSIGLDLKYLVEKNVPHELSDLTKFMIRTYLYQILDDYETSRFECSNTYLFAEAGVASGKKMYYADCFLVNKRKMIIYELKTSHIKGQNKVVKVAEAMAEYFSTINIVEIKNIQPLNQHYTDHFVSVSGEDGLAFCKIGEYFSGDVEDSYDLETKIKDTLILENCDFYKDSIVKRSGKNYVQHLSRESIEGDVG